MTLDVILAEADFKSIPAKLLFRLLPPCFSSVSFVKALSSCGYNHVTLLDGLSCKPNTFFVSCSSFHCLQKSYVRSNRSIISSFSRFYFVPPVSNH